MLFWRLVPSADLLSSIDVPTDLERLSKERALGDARHRKQVGGSDFSFIYSY